MVLQIKDKQKNSWYLMRNLSENVLDGTTFLLTTPTDFFILGILLYLQKNSVSATIQKQLPLLIYMT